MVDKLNLMGILIVMVLVMTTVYGSNSCECDESYCLYDCRCGNTDTSQACIDCVASKSCEPTNDLLPTMTPSTPSTTPFGGNCPCNECLSECRCGNSDTSQECKDCVASNSCQATNEEECNGVKFILHIILNVCGFLGSVGWCRFCNKWRNEEVNSMGDCCYKYLCKAVLFVLSIAGACGYFHFKLCDCDDPWDCSAYSAGELTCGSFGGDKCKWDGYSSCLNNNKCVCCTRDFGNEVVSIWEMLSGVEAIGGSFVGILWCLIGCWLDARKVKQQNNVKQDTSYPL